MRSSSFLTLLIRARLREPPTWYTLKLCPVDTVPESPLLMPRPDPMSIVISTPFGNGCTAVTRPVTLFLHGVSGGASSTHFSLTHFLPSPHWSSVVHSGFGCSTGPSLIQRPFLQIRPRAQSPSDRHGSLTHLLSRSLQIYPSGHSPPQGIGTHRF